MVGAWLREQGVSMLPSGLMPNRWHDAVQEVRLSPPSLEVYLSPGWVHLTSENWADVQARFLLAQPSSVDAGGFLDGPCDSH